MTTTRVVIPPPTPATRPAAPASAPREPVRPMVLFDGKTLAGWQVVEEADFQDRGEVSVVNGSIVLNAGNPATGIRWTRDFPEDDYQVTLEAMRIEGADFFCGMTFPVGDSYCTWIVGGWGGNVIGLSNIDGQHAAANETTSGQDFQTGRWYRLRLRVTRDKIEAWIDDKSKIDFDRAGRRLSIWAEQYPVRPFGIDTWYTKAALRNIRVGPADAR